MPERTGDGVGKFVVVNDTNIDLLAEKLADAIQKEMGGQPHLIVAKFERKCVDANRPAKEGYGTSEDQLPAGTEDVDATEEEMNGQKHAAACFVTGLANE